MSAFHSMPVLVALFWLFSFQAAADAAVHDPGKAQNPVPANVVRNSGQMPDHSRSAVTPKRVAPVISSEFSEVDIVPDGNLGKKFWSSAKRVRFDEAAFSREKYPKIKTIVASRWTANYLYLAFWCHYQTLNTYQGEDPAVERMGLWEKDVVESFINPQPEHPSHYYEFEVAPTNQWIDLEIDLDRTPSGNPKWNSGFKHATRIDPARHVWTSEWRIPAQSMKVERIRPNAEWRLNFYRSDGPDDARRNLSWGAVPRKDVPALFHQPASFGTIRFVGAPMKLEY